MQIIMISIMALCALCSCSKELEVDDPILPDIEIEESLVQFRCSAPTAPTKSISDAESSTVGNLNLFYYNERLGIFKHEYFSDPSDVEIMLMNSSWDLYFIANVGRNLNGLTLPQVKDYSATMSQEDDLKEGGGVVMSCHRRVNITSNCSINISLERIVSRVNVSVTLAESVQGVIDVTDIKIYNIPNSCSIFDPNSPTETTVNYSKPSSSSGGSFSFYMFENLQGENNAITRPEDKIASNAPTNATYIIISAKSAMADIKYCIYLGENTINNFDIHRNRDYNVDIVINGSNTEDLRVTLESYELMVEFSKSLPESIGWQEVTFSVFKLLSATSDDVTVSFNNIEGGRFTVSLWNNDTWVDPDNEHRPDYSHNEKIVEFTTTDYTDIVAGKIKPGTNYRLYISNYRAKDATLRMDMVFNDGLPNENTIPIDIAYGYQ